MSGTGIDVDTSNRVVTLRGTVSSEAEKQRAIEIARAVEGVAEVRDELVVGTGGAGAQSRSGAQTRAPGAGGTAERTGTAGTAGPARLDDEEIARDVRQAIQRQWAGGQLRLDGEILKGPRDTEIGVSVDNGVVMIEEKVPRVGDMLTAARAARGVAGVRAVRTNMESGRPS